MELCDQYVHELIQLVPELNDFHHLPEYNHLRPKAVNTLTKDFQKKERELYKKYYKLVKHKKQKSFYDLIFLDDLKIMIKESKYISLDHVPIDSLENLPLTHIAALQGETDYEFTDKKSYQDFLERFKIIPEITESILTNMRQGIKHKDTLPRIIVLDLRDQYKNTLDLDLEEINVPTNVKKEVIESIQEYIIPSIRKLKDFLENEYLCKCTEKIGLNSLSGGQTIYKGLLEEQTMKGFTPKDIHDLGLREVTRLMNLLNKLKKKMNFKGSLEEFYKHTTETFKDRKDIFLILKNFKKKYIIKFIPSILRKH